MGSLHRADELSAGIVETALELVFGTGHVGILDRTDAAQSCRRTSDAGVVIRWGASAFAAREFRVRGYRNCAAVRGASLSCKAAISFALRQSPRRR